MPPFKSTLLSDIPVHPRGVPLEVAVYSAESALLAQSAGAHRVQLNLPGSSHVGGLTPSPDLLRRLRFPPPNAPPPLLNTKLEIPVRVVIRPRPAPGPYDREPHDWIYSEDEFEQMKRDIVRFKELGTMNPFIGDAFVFGILRRVRPLQYVEPRKKRYAASSDTESTGDHSSAGSQSTMTTISSVSANDGSSDSFSSSSSSSSSSTTASNSDTSSSNSDSSNSDPSPSPSPSSPEFVIDWDRCHQLVDLALPIRCCFSRAFDTIAAQPHRHHRRSLARLHEMGFTGVLTAGGSGSFLDNRDRLLAMMTTARGGGGGPDIQLVVAEGVTSDNVHRLLGQPRPCRMADRNVWTHSPCFYKVPLSVGMDPETTSAEEVDALRHAQGICDPEYPTPGKPWRQIYH